MTRVRGRTPAQLREDREAVRTAIGVAVASFVAEGLLYPCDEHEDGDVVSCGRCQWINEQLGAGPFERPGAT